MSSTVERRREDADQALLSVEGLKTHFPVNTGVLDSIKFDRSRDGLPFTVDDSSVKAVDGVNFDLHAGETLGVVGESGCGKSTLARTVVGLEDPTDGIIRFDGRDVTEFDKEDERWFRENVQMVFQDPMSSLNPRRKVGEIIADPLEAAGRPKEERESRAMELLEQVGLESDYYGRYPHEFSGGQRQRINLARALSINPDLVIADEPVSGLDMSVQAQILSLMNDLQDEYGLTYLFITHDLGVIRNMADRVAVMYVGDFVETGPTEQLFTEPHHPYTRSLLDAVPNPNPDTTGVVAELKGDVPSPTNPPSGCKFHTRCPAFVLPDGFTEEGYAEFAEFRDDVVARDLDADGSPEVVVESYFDRNLPGDARRAVLNAVEAAQKGEWNGALESLEAHESPCDSVKPELEQISGPTHHSACHLPADEREAFEW
ncbi:ABC transporter ATP-binding protein [Halorussus amylolyticus]|uniref:ABC transporter ATP-binding protein n=1 Tax=Halorussus amylolyticus TaxID=1126242 RepID=UPI001053848E|nr:oligopeptide/dipeptide ABC transporter ATP-binding protein [Halorussus amylolyticus]